MALIKNVKLDWRREIPVIFPRDAFPARRGRLRSHGGDESKNERQCTRGGRGSSPHDKESRSLASPGNREKQTRLSPRRGNNRLRVATGNVIFVNRRESEMRAKRSSRSRDCYRVRVTSLRNQVTTVLQTSFFFHGRTKEIQFACSRSGGNLIYDSKRVQTAPRFSV